MLGVFKLNRLRSGKLHSAGLAFTVERPNNATYRYPAGGPSEQLPRRIPPEQAALANVAAHGGIRGMARLLSD